MRFFIRPKTTCLAIALVGLVITARCSPASREKLVHFFFEVPDESATEPGEAESQESDTEPLPEMPKPPVRFASVHEPYRTRQCQTCHDADSRMQVREDVMTACETCHPRYFSDAVVHYPAQEQECDLCHVPHHSQQPNLMLTSVYESCSECHEIDDLEEEPHAVDFVKNCTACHDPHFGEDVLLKPGWDSQLSAAAAAFQKSMTD